MLKCNNCGDEWDTTACCTGGPCRYCASGIYGSIGATERLQERFTPRQVAEFCLTDGHHGRIPPQFEAVAKLIVDCVFADRAAEPASSAWLAKALEEERYLLAECRKERDRAIRDVEVAEKNAADWKRMHAGAIADAAAATRRADGLQKRLAACKEALS